MVGSMMPIAVSHGEGRVEVRDGAHLAALESKGLVALRYVDNFGKVTETYPANPNGSPNGITAVTTENGRVTIRTARGCVSSATRVNSSGNQLDNP